MFVQHSIHIGHPIGIFSDILATGPREWFARLDDAGHSTVGPQVAGVGIRNKVAVEVGHPVASGDWIEIPITWKATFVEQLFPVMIGRVELAPVDPQTTKLAVSGMYEPPLGPVGLLLDEAFMHAVAEATVKDLAESLAKQFDAALSTRA